MMLKRCGAGIPFCTPVFNTPVIPVFRAMLGEVVCVKLTCGFSLRAMLLNIGLQAFAVVNVVVFSPWIGQVNPPIGF